MAVDQTKQATQGSESQNDRTVQVPPVLTVRELAALMGVSPIGRLDGCQPDRRDQRVDE
jgi:hypothetical protein